MNVTGIIAEYNPFHNGHAHHLKIAREKLASDYIIVVMSGNYVQRGAPTIIDKYSRAEMALRCGADLVLELPVWYSTASAEYFAYGGISILDRLGVVENLCFGTESLDDDNPDSECGVHVDEINGYFSKIAELMLEEPPEYKEIIKSGTSSGLSYAASCADAVGKILGDGYRTVMETSNNILGVEYMKAIKRIGSVIKPKPCARLLSKHNDEQVIEGFSSATSIRNSVFNKYDPNSISRVVPEEVFKILMDRYLVSFPIFRDDFSLILGSKLVNAEKSGDLTKYFGITGDLANRMIKNKGEFKSFNQFRLLLDCKSFNRATIGRALMHIILGIHKEDMEGLYDRRFCESVRVLGFRKKAEPLLTEIKKKSKIRLVTKLSDYVSENSERDFMTESVRAELIYRLICMNKFDTELKMPYEQQLIIIDD